MTPFRCWQCNRAFYVDDARRGERFDCPGCKHRLKVPHRPNGSSRARSLTDWVVEVVVYGGCGGLLGFGLGVLVVSRLPLFRRSEEAALLVAGLTAAGLLAGAVFGEAGVNWVGRRIRSREEA